MLQPETEDRELNVTTLIHEPMALVAPLKHSLVTYTRVDPADLKDETILHTEAGCTYRILFEQYLNKHGIFSDPSLEFWSIEAIKQCVMAGLGIALLPLVTVQNELREGKMARLAWDDSEQQVATQVAYHTKKWKSPALSEFLQIVEQHVTHWRA